MALVQKQFSDLITFTRSSAGGRFNERGLFEMVPANQPRFDYDPITRQPLGLLIEENRTNLIVNSSDYALWNNNGAGAPLVIVPSQADGPLGLSTMSRISRSDLGIRYLTRSFASAAGSTITASQHAKAGAIGGWLAMRIQTNYGNRVDAFFNLITGEFSYATTGDVSAVSARMVSVGGGVWRCICTATSGAVPWSSILLAPQDRRGAVDLSPSELSEVFLDATQVEVGSFETSFIPTGGSQVTRTSDIARVSTLTPWYNRSEGTMFAIFKPAASRTTEFRAIMSLDDGTVRNRLQAYMAAPAGNAEFRASSGDISVPVPSIPAAYPPNINRLGKSALSYDSKGLTGGAGSALSKARIAFTPPEVTSFKIGSNQSQGQLLNGHIVSISYYPRRLTDSELEVLTT